MERPIRASSASSAPTCARPPRGCGSSGRVEPDDRADLALDADSTDLLATDELLLRVRRALGNAEAQALGFTGAGLFRGRWRGTLGAPVFEGRFSGRDVGYAGVVWGKAEWAGSADIGSVRSHSLVLSRGGAELWLDGLVETGFFGGRGRASTPGCGSRAGRPRTS